MFVRSVRSLRLGVLTTAAISAASITGAQSSGSIFVTPIPGAQFSGTVHVDRTDIQPNGAIVQLWSERQIARDSTGRIYNEYRPFVLAGTNQTPRINSIHLYDPQNRMSEYLYPQRKVYQMTILSRPPATDTPDAFASPTFSSAQPSEFTHQEDLGYRTIAGLQTHGVSITQTLPKAQSGTGKEVVVTNEYWYSDALRLNLMTRHTDSRTGTVTMTVTNLNRAEPNPALFGVPPDYTMTEEAR